MQMAIIAAKHDCFDGIMEFYYDLIDTMQNTEFDPGWERDIYPTREFIQNSIQHGELFIVLLNDGIVGAMVMNHECADGYGSVQWKIKANKNEAVVLHTLGVSPRYQGKGVAKKMVAYAIKACAENGIKALRLDVLASNIPAQKLYAGMGFIYIDKIRIYYEDTGLMDFLLYELPLGV